MWMEKQLSGLNGLGGKGRLDNKGAQGNWWQDEGYKGILQLDGGGNRTVFICQDLHDWIQFTICILYLNQKGFDKWMVDLYIVIYLKELSGL